MVGAPDDGAVDRRGSGSTASLFGTQLLLFLVVLMVAGLAELGSSPIDDGWLIRGLVLLSILTVVVAVSPPAVVPWILLAAPLADVLVLVVLRMACPSGGFGVLLVIPVVWLTLVGGRKGAIVASAVTTAAVWLEVLVEQTELLALEVDPPAVAASASVNVGIVFVSVVTAAAVRRDRAHRRLVRLQAASVEDSFRTARREQRVLQAVMDSVPFAILSVDPHGAVAGTNRAARAIMRMVGFNPSMRLVRYPLYHLDGVTPVSPGDFPHLRGLRGEPVDGETYWLGHADGPRLAVEVSARLVLDDEGNVDRLVTVVRDVGDSVAAEEARDRAVTSVSHEFRTPLSSILGYIELAADTPGLPAEVSEHLQVAERNTTRLLTLVNDFLAARGRSPATELPMTYGVVDLVAVAAESVTALMPLAQDRFITLTLDAPDQARVEGDAFRLRQVVDNVVGNAIKYNVDGGTVVVEVDLDDERAELTVTDNGPGLTDRELTEVFEPYQRSRAASSTVEGTGMGLAICRDIIDKHGGTIELRHANGGGTSVLVVLPRQQEDTA